MLQGQYVRVMISAYEMNCELSWLWKLSYQAAGSRSLENLKNTDQVSFYW